MYEKKIRLTKDSSKKTRTFTDFKIESDEPKSNQRWTQLPLAPHALHKIGYDRNPDLLSHHLPRMSRLSHQGELS